MSSSASDEDSFVPDLPREKSVSFELLPPEKSVSLEREREDGDNHSQRSDGIDNTDIDNAVPTAKYVQGRVGMARGVFKKMRVLNKSFRHGVFVINLEDGGGSISFYLNLKNLAPQAKRNSVSVVAGNLSVAACMESFVAPPDQPYLHIPSDVSWEFRRVSDKKFQIAVPKVNGKPDPRVVLRKYIIPDINMPDISITNLPNELRQFYRGDDDNNLRSSTSISTTSLSIDSPNTSRRSQKFEFSCDHGGEVAVFAKAANSVEKNFTKEYQTNKYLVLPQSNVRVRSKQSLQISAQSNLIDRSKSARDLDARCMSSIGEQEFRCYPLYCYPNQFMTKHDLVLELRRTSRNVRDLCLGTPDEIGSLKVEVLQCSGLPKLDAYSLTDAYCYLACGSSTFVTDVIQDNCNPCWLPLCRRACIFPLHNAYSQVFIGVFDYDGEKSVDDFAGRVVIDVSKLQPDLSMDITLPLREYSRVYKRKGVGNIRVRLQLSWTKGERAAMLSYLPTSLSSVTKHTKHPRDPVTVVCPDVKSFHNITLTVYGKDMPGRFTMNMQKAVTNEVKLIKGMLIYHAKTTALDILLWRTPILSAYFFSWWMYMTLTGLSDLPSFLLSLVAILMIQNYLIYHVSSSSSQMYGHRTLLDLTKILMFGDKSGEPRNTTNKRCQHLIERILCKIFGVEQKSQDHSNSWKFEDHSEFPFSIGAEYPKTTSYEAAVFPIWEAAQDDRQCSNNNDEMSIASSDDSIRNSSDDGSIDDYFDNSDDEKDEGDLGAMVDKAGAMVEKAKRLKNKPIRILKKKTKKKGKERKRPTSSLVEDIEARIPHQDVTHSSKKGKSIKAELEEFHSKAQKANLHLYDDRVFIAQDRRDGERILRFNPGGNPISKALNPILASALKLFDVELSAFRALFNILFWKDAMLSYWAFLLVIFLMIVSFIFPWQKFFFVLGLGLLGPQNYFLVDWYYLTYLRRKGLTDMASLNGKTKQKMDAGNGSLRGTKSYDALSQSPLLLRNNTQFKPSPVVREVIVPSIPFHYNRFYDWPPDPALTTVKPIDESGSSNKLKITRPGSPSSPKMKAS